MRWSWRGAVALVLALCVGGGWAVAVISVAVSHYNLTDPAAGLLSTLGGLMAGALAGWLGGWNHHRRDEGNHDDE